MDVSEGKTCTEIEEDGNRQHRSHMLRVPRQIADHIQYSRLSPPPPPIARIAE